MILLKTRLGCFKIFLKDSFFLSHDFNSKERDEERSFFNNFFLTGINQQEIYGHYLRDLELKPFFWHDKIGIKEVFEKDDYDEIKLMGPSTIIENLKKYKLSIKEIDPRNYLFIGLNDKKKKDDELNFHLFMANKKFDELDLDEKKKLFSNENLLKKNDFLYEIVTINGFQNFIIRDADQTLCFLDNNFNELIADFCVYSKGINKYSPFLRGSGMFFLALVPVSMKNSRVFADFNEKLAEKKLILAEEMLNIIFDFIYSSKGDINDFRENIGLFDEIKDNLEILNEEKDLRFNIDFFRKKKGVHFSEFLSLNKKEKIMHYFNLFLKNYEKILEESLKLFIREKSSVLEEKLLDFDELMIDFLLKLSKKLNYGFFSENKDLFNICEKICENDFSKNFEDLMIAKPAISFGISEFFINNRKDFSPNTNLNLERAVESLLETKSFSPIKTTEAITKYYSEIKEMIKKALESGLI